MGRYLSAARDVVITMSCAVTALCCGMAAYDSWRIGRIIREREREEMSEA
jgi:hypothetical protein